MTKWVEFSFHLMLLSNFLLMVRSAPLGGFGRKLVKTKCGDWRHATGDRKQNEFKSNVCNYA